MARLGRLVSPSGGLHLVSILLSAVTASLFWILWCWPIVISPKYSLKTTQQIINFLVPVFATGFGILFKDCLGRTNEAQSAATLEKSRLSFGGLEMHHSAARESIFKLTKSFFQTKTVRSRALFFLICLVAYTTLSWVLSVIFIAELHSTGLGNDGANPNNYADIRLPISMPFAQDPCVNSTGATNCYYDLAAAPLTTLLINQNFTYIAGMRFTPVYQGPQGVPYDVLDHFVEQAANTSYPDMETKYCAPRLLPQSYYCRRDVGNTRVRYEYYNIFNNSGMYKVIIDPDTPYETDYPRPANADGSIASWTIAASYQFNNSLDTIITANGEGAKLLSKLAWLNLTVTNNTEPLTMICTLNASYSWSWQYFQYTNNIFQLDVLADSVPELCSNDPSMTPLEYNENSVPFVNILAAIEGATNSIGSITGYSKLLNLDAPVIYDDVYGRNMRLSESWALSQDMTELELYLSAIYGTVMTMYSTSLTNGITRTPIRYVSSLHNYQITISWTVLSIFAQVAACLVFLCTLWQAISWAKAITSIETSIDDRDLLKPLNLAAYSATIADELKAMMRDDSEGKLRVPKGDNVGFGPAGVVRVNDRVSVVHEAPKCVAS